MQRINLLDLGRFIASLSVILYHYFYSGVQTGYVTSIDYIEPVAHVAKYGKLGVSFFFMISGYVIFYSALNKSAYEFLVSRMKRLYPSYWFAVLFTGIIALLIGAGSIMEVSIKQILVNLTMLQDHLNTKEVDGVYWTLHYELRFYLSVFFVLFLTNESILQTILKLWPFLIAIFGWYGVFGFFFDIKFCYFSFGVLIAMYNKDKSISTAIPLAVSVLLCLIVVNVPSVTTADYIISTILVILFMAFFHFLRFENVRNYKIKYSFEMGALTYPIYLIHAHFGYMCLNYFANEQNKYYVLIIILLIVFLVAYFMFKVIEFKLRVFWDSLFRLLLLPVMHLEKLFKKTNISKALIFDKK